MKRGLVLFFLISVIGINSVFAGTRCEQKSYHPSLLARAGEKAISLKNTLDRLNADVALVARVGSDMSRYNIYYTHLAFAVRNYPGRKGQWTVIHLLNQCGTSKSAVYAQGLFNFFMDDLYTMDFRVIVPTPDLQKKIVTTLKSPLIRHLHNPNYSLVSYPFSLKYQNSNQWILEMLIAAGEGLKSREMIQKALYEKGFVPFIVKIDATSKLGAALLNTAIRFDDHPMREQQTNQYSVVTVNSVVNYLIQIGKVKPDKNPGILGEK